MHSGRRSNAARRILPLPHRLLTQQVAHTHQSHQLVPHHSGERSRRSSSQSSVQDQKPLPVACSSSRRTSQWPQGQQQQHQTPQRNSTQTAAATARADAPHPCGPGAACACSASSRRVVGPWAPLTELTERVCVSHGGPGRSAVLQQHCPRQPRRRGELCCRVVRRQCADRAGTVMPSHTQRPTPPLRPAAALFPCARTCYCAQTTGVLKVSTAGFNWRRQQGGKVVDIKKQGETPGWCTCTC